MRTGLGIERLHAAAQEHSLTYQAVRASRLRTLDHHKPRGAFQVKSTVRSFALIATLAMSLAACGGSSDEAAVPEVVTWAPPPVVVEPPPPAAAFTLTLDTDKMVLLQGGTASVRATVTRSPGFSDAVTIELAGLPQGVSAAPAVVSAGAGSIDIVLAAQAAAPHSLPTTGSAHGQGGGQSASKPLTVTVRGLAGEVDTSFAGGSIVTPVDISDDYVNAVTVQADGKVVVAGSARTIGGTQLSVLRYGRDGGLDATFGNGGKVLTAVGTHGDDVATAVAVQPDGKIVVAGASNQGGAAGLDFALLRYNADGSRDATFGNGGIVLTDFGSASDRAWALLLMADGKIVLGGETNTGTTAGGVDFALARYRADGSLDAAFGNGGKVVTGLKSNAGTDIVRALATQTVQGATRILAVGGEGDFIAARYTDNGALDAGYGVNGKVLGLFNSGIGSARAVSVLPGGEAVLAGHIGHDFAAVQLTASGQLDNRFGAAADGRFTMSVSPSNWNEATTLVRQADGKLLLGGWAAMGAGSAGDFAVLRLNAEGRVDTGFGNSGVTIKPMAPSAKNDLAHAAVLQSDERIPSVRAIVAGEANDSNHDAALTRLWL
jgi:uncharacterized delta-60 repeat protein